MNPLKTITAAITLAIAVFAIPLGITPAMAEECKKYTSLHKAIDAENYDKALRKMNPKSVNVMAKKDDDYDCETALHLATKKGAPKQVIDALIVAGADVNAKDKFDDTPLIFATWNGHTETAQALIVAGADVNAKNNYRGWSPLHFAARNGYTEITQALIAAGADVNAKVEEKGGFIVSWVPLHFAANNGNTETVIALIKAGADVNVKDNEGMTPLDVAEDKNHTETADAMRAAAP